VALRERVDGEAVLAGALADAAILGPVVAIYAALRGLGVVSANGVAVDVTAVLGALVAPLVGGIIAGRRDTTAPLTNGALGAGAASIAYVVFRIIDGAVRSRPVHPSTVVILVIIAGTIGMLGGWAGFRSRPGARPGPPLADSSP
jgi:hypothetical protein